MDTNAIQEYIEKEFASDCGYTVIRNVLEYMEGHSEKERYEFFNRMFGGIGLTEKEIKGFSKVQ